MFPSPPVQGVCMCVSICTKLVVVVMEGGGLEVVPMALARLLCVLAFKAQRSLGNWDFNLQVSRPCHCMLISSLTPFL